MPRGVYKHKPNQVFQKGHKMAEETKKKISETHKRNNYSPPVQNWLKKGNKYRFLGGKNHYNWKGGLTPLKIQIRKCFKYRQWRSDVFTRDDFTCQKCGLKGVYLEADHYPKSFLEIFQEYKIKTLEEALNCEEFWNINNGRTLCLRCHRPLVLKSNLLKGRNKQKD